MIGIMQGRLLPRYNNRYQSHPLGFWQSEFFIAKELGFDSIEFILDYNDFELNPLMSENGIEEILNISKESGIKVKSICADYFMEAPFHSSKQENSEKVLLKLIKNSSKLGASDIVIPCVDHSSLKSDNDKEMLEESLKKILPIAQEYNINLNLESDMNSQEFKCFLNRFNNKNLKVNYDIGNSASLGYDVLEEFKAYGEYISDLHIKDRILNGGSVELGTGNANFELVFSLLQKYNFKGIITMQASRDINYIDDLLKVKRQFEFTKSLIDRYLK